MTEYTITFTEAELVELIADVGAHIMHDGVIHPDWDSIRARYPYDPVKENRAINKLMDALLNTPATKKSVVDIWAAIEATVKA